MIEESQVLTVEEEAFCDAVSCKYFLVKQEIPHTTNFSLLRNLCARLGNTTMCLLDKAGNANF